MEDTRFPHPISNDPFIKFYRLLPSVKDDDRSVVLITNGFLELLVETLLRAKCKNGRKITADHRTFPYSAKLLILHEIGAIEDPTYQFLDVFRRVRNDAAHKPFFEINEATIQQMSGYLNQRDLTLADLCMYFVGEFWNQNHAIFMPEFLPGLTSMQKQLEDLHKSTQPPVDDDAHAD